MNRSKLIILLAAYCGYTLNVNAHEALDPRVTLDVENASLQEVIEPLFLQSHVQFSAPGELMGAGKISISITDQPLSSVLEILRSEHHLCAYRGTSIAPTTMVKIRSCEEVDRDCSSGMSEPFPRPKLITSEDGVRLRPNIGPYLCGGREYIQRLRDGTTHRPM